MGTIAMSVTETGFGTVTKSYTVADTDIDRIVTSYQAEADAYWGTPGSSRNQVLLYINNRYRDEIASHVYKTETTAAQAAVVPVTPPVMV